MKWDREKKEATVRLKPTTDSIWLATQAMYPHSRLVALVEVLKQSPHARVEVVGKSVRGRDLFLITVTDFEKPDAGKKTVWLQARQHAWERGTSYVAEGALRFAVSETAEARSLREKTICKVVIAKVLLSIGAICISHFAIVNLQSPRGDLISRH
jgi:murein tripeptide amidase MpaA